MPIYPHRESLTNDLMFKAVFGQDTPQCRRTLIAFLNLILGRKEDPIVAIQYQNPFSIASLTTGKVIIMDILVETQSQEQIDIEMQVETDPILIDRSLYYLCDLATQGLERGQDYVKLKKSIVICIIRGRLFPELSLTHPLFAMQETTCHLRLTSQMELHFLELGKFRWEGREPEELSPLEQVVAYICCTGNPDKQAYVEALVGTGNEVIGMTDELLKKASEDKQLWAYRRSREMYEFDEARRRMRAKEQGKTEEKTDIVQHMRAKGLSAAQISDLTGLSTEEINAIM